MNTAHHLFLSDSGEMLPRWREAFPQAVAGRTGDGRVPPFEYDIVWLRLRSDLPVTEQLRLARSRLGERSYIALSDTPSDDEALAAFSALAKGYCNSHATPQLLQQVATVVAQGGLWIGASLMQRLLIPVNPLLAATSQDNLADMLTQRELEVARTIAAGASNKEIASQLGITERTVKAHIGAIFEKLNVRDRLQLAMLIRDQHHA